MQFSRITIDPNQMDGVPCIRGLKIPVATVVGMLAEDIARDEILRLYPDLESDDISEALRLATIALHELELIPDDEAYLYTPYWQEAIRKSEEELASGNFKSTTDLDELFKDLNN